MLLDNHCIVAQLPPKKPSQRLRPTISGRSHALSSNSRILPVASSVSRSIVLSAFVATRREFSPSRPSSLAVNSSISLRSLSSRLRSLSVKSFAVEVLSIQSSFQPPPVPGLGVQRGEVVLAPARHFETRLPQCGDDIGTIPHHAVLDALEQVVPDQVAGGCFEPEPGPQPCRLDIGAVAGLLHPGPRRVVRASPAVFVIECVPEGTEGLLPARRGDVEAPAGLQVAPRGEDMDVSAAATLAVQHGRPGVAVGFEPGPGRVLESVQNRLDLGVGRLVLRRPRDHAGRVPVLELQRVGQGGHFVRIASKDFDALARLPGRVPLPEKVVRGVPRRAGPAGQELNQHPRPCFQEGTAPIAPA